MFYTKQLNLTTDESSFVENFKNTIPTYSVKLEDGDFYGFINEKGFGIYPKLSRRNFKGLYSEGVKGFLENGKIKYKFVRPIETAIITRFAPAAMLLISTLLYLFFKDDSIKDIIFPVIIFSSPNLFHSKKLRNKLNNKLCNIAQTAQTGDD